MARSRRKKYRIRVKPLDNRPRGFESRYQYEYSSYALAFYDAVRISSESYNNLNLTHRVIFYYWEYDEEMREGGLWVASMSFRNGILNGDLPGRMRRRAIS